MSGDELRAAGMAAIWKLMTWDLRPRERVLGSWIVRLSLLQGRASVWVRRLGLFAELTGIDDSDVSDGLRSLAKRGVLQIAGDRSGAKLYTFLPNAELVQPEGRVAADVVSRCVGQIEHDNAQGPALGVAIGDIEPGGQMRAVELEPAESRLAGEFASASRELALEADDTGFVPWSQEWVRVMSARSMGLDGSRGPGCDDESERVGRNVPEVNRVPVAAVSRPMSGGNIVGPNVNNSVAMGESPIRGAPVPRAYARAPETLTCTITKEDVNVRGGSEMTMTKTALKSAGKSELAAQALRAVWAVLPKSEFDPWHGRWVERCNAEPELVLGFAEDCADRLKRGEKIAKPGAWIFKAVARCESMAGRPWR